RAKLISRQPRVSAALLAASLAADQTRVWQRSPHRRTRSNQRAEAEKVPAGHARSSQTALLFLAAAAGAGTIRSAAPTRPHSFADHKRVARAYAYPWLPCRHPATSETLPATDGGAAAPPGSALHAAGAGLRSHRSLETAWPAWMTRRTGFGRAVPPARRAPPAPRDRHARREPASGCSTSCGAERHHGRVHHAPPSPGSGEPAQGRYSCWACGRCR